MNTRHRITTLTAAAALTLSLTTGTASATTYTYGDFSLMFQRSAGQYDDTAGNVAGQWAWSPQSTTISDIAWGDPATWPPYTYEQFHLSTDSQWVLFDGYGSTDGQWQNQTVTTEEIGDANCQNNTPIPTDGGKEHYVQWNIPTTTYCLQAWGTLYPPGQPTADYYHKQIWTPPAPCTNPYYTGQLCITQYEEFSDNYGNPGGPLVLLQKRTQSIALGIGPAFHINDTLNTWQANLRYNWNY